MGSVLPSADYITPTHGDYALFSVGQRPRVPRHPTGVVLAQNEAQVVKSVLCAQKAGINHVVPRAGGHSYEDFSSQDNAIVVDIAAINYVTVTANNGDTGLAKVGAGARLGKVYSDIFNQGGFNFNGGTCPTVGIGGHVSGGGYGMVARQFGVAADRVVSIRMVLYNGTIVVANSTQHQDLYWAVRGGGSGSFGIITEFVISVFKTTQNAMFKIAFDHTKQKELLAAWMRYFPSSDARLTTQYNVDKHGSTLVGQFLGTKDQVQKMIQDSGMLSLGGIKEQTWSDNCNSVGAKAFMWTSSCDRVDILNVPTYLSQNDKEYSKSKSDYGSVLLPQAGIDAVVDGLANSPDWAWIQFEALGGVFATIPTNATPYVHRDALFSMQYAVSMQKGQDRTAPNYQWILNYEQSLKPFVNGQHYQNYCDMDIGPNYGVAYWGQENFDRLKKIKPRYDPHNIFRSEQSVPLQ
ncbi:hypothetical protein HK103_007267 [Boothiomyces macroporosus]|uniref:FAD-binding PCMH-type domain-containing protein n=1 Tax=Boothiomyces macroporosus TaxID=261099 RepID=A0AAD5UFI6_9FUNG|nr:hypothetical protein HK103_007267 [Boothiomyces macroporosus]